MRVRFLVALFAALAFSTAANAELNTLQYVSFDDNGAGRLDLDGTKGDLIDSGSGPIAVDVSGAASYTLNDGEGGDMWNGGDQFTYLYDSNKTTGDFTATARVIGQTESVDGRWGKGGITAQANLSGLGQSAMAQVAAGTGSQLEPPLAGDHSIVPVRIGGRTAADGTGGYERPVLSSAGAEITNNVFPEAEAGVVNPTTNVSWLRLQYKSETNTFISGFAPDVDGAPGEWGYSADVTDVPVPSADDGEGWFVGLGYSAHNSLAVNDLADSDAVHGIVFDSYSIVPEFLLKEVAVNGTLELGGQTENVVFGDPVQSQGLAQYWFDANMRANPEAFLEAGTTGTEDYPLLNPGGNPFVTENTWWRGGQTNPLTELELDSYPATQLAGTRFENSGNEDNYSVKLQGEIFIAEDGEYLIRDGIDDFTMIAIDADGNGELDDLDGLVNGDVGTVGGSSFGDVHVLDDDWANADGGSQAVEFHGIADIENISGDGEWRKIEIWMAEGGGGDAGIVYMGNLDDPDIFDDLEGGALPQEQRDAFIINPENLRSEVAPIVSGDSTASLSNDANYIVTANADGADQISVDDGGGVLTTTLDVSGATVTVNADGLAEGTSIQLFDAGSVTGTDTLTLNLADASAWDLSQLSSGIITFGAGAPVCDPSAGPDIDGDGTVGFSDFLILSNNFGNAVEGAGHLQGDLDCSGDVAFADFLALSNEFGNAVGAEASSVPEPSGLALLGVAGLLGGLIRRRRR